MTYKKLETMRQVRLMVTEVIIPLMTATVTLLSIPEVRNAAKNKYNEIKRKREQKRSPIIFEVKRP